MGKLGTHIEDSDQRMTALENRQGMDNEQNIPVLKVVKRLEYRSLDQEAHSRRNNVEQRGSVLFQNQTMSVQKPYSKISWKTSRVWPKT